MDGELEEMSRVSSRESSHKDVDTSRNSLKVGTNKLNVKIKDEKKIGFERDADSIGSTSSTGDGHHKVPNKIIANWRHACDRTRDRTRDLLKRWRTLPEFDPSASSPTAGGSVGQKTESLQRESGWSVHVWSKDIKTKNITDSHPTAHSALLVLVV